MRCIERGDVAGSLRGHSQISNDSGRVIGDIQIFVRLFQDRVSSSSYTVENTVVALS